MARCVLEIRRTMRGLGLAHVKVLVAVLMGWVVVRSVAFPVAGALV